MLSIFRKKNKLEEVFTPSSSARLTYIERPELNKQIDKALLISGMQIILYGHSGGGKSTIIQNILISKKIKYISSNCTQATNIESLILDAFDKLNPYYLSETNKTKTDSISTQIKSVYQTISSSLKSETKFEHKEVHQRILDVQLSPQRLAEFLGCANVVWIIEDFHKVNIEEREKLSQILKIFVDTSSQFNKVKVIAIGAVGTAREVVNYNSELLNRIAEIYVPLLTNSEIETIIKKGEKLLNVNFNEVIHDGILKYANSLASICHHLCFSICYNNGILSTTKSKKNLDYNELVKAIEDYLNQNSDSFKETLDKALKTRDENSANTKLIIEAFCNIRKEEVTIFEIQNYKHIKKLFKGNLKQYLDLLTTADYGEIIRYDNNSGKYYFSNPFFKAYALMTFAKEKTTTTPNNLNMDEVKIIMEILDKNGNVLYRSIKKTNGRK